MKQLPQQPESPNVRVLAQTYREDFANVTDTLTLTYTPLLTVDGRGLEAVFVDGVFRHPSAYTLDGNVLTFSVALAGTETVTAFYPYRS